MADFDITVNDAALKLETHTNINVDNDEDLIDYDSDDAFVMEPCPEHTTNTTATQTLDAEEFVTEATPAVPDASESAKMSQGAAPLPGATISESGQQEIGAAGEQGQDDGNFDDFALEGENAAEQVLTTTGADQARGSIHEIDYEDDGFAFDVPAGGVNQPPSAASPENVQDSEDPMPEVPKSAATEAPAKHYEIDWEDDEESVGFGTEEGTAQGGTDAVAADVYADNIGEQDPKAAQESFDAEDEAAQPEDQVAAQEPAQPEPFPAIIVQYRGEEFPMFSFSSDGFFSDISILDENMKVVLDGLREELADEIGPHDDLVLQVDKLGLEFSESSPSDTLSEINLRQVSEILDILVKNKDFDDSRILYTYLFTRPNTMKRYEFLVESATGDKGLAEVIHLFQPPTHGNTLEATGAHDGHEEQLDSYESTGDDATAHSSHDNTEAYGDAAFLDDGYAHNDDYQDENDAGRDEGPVDPSTGEAVAIGLQDSSVGGATDVQPNLTKRSFPGEPDGDDGNDVKRRRS
ncbi:conserved glutamic acid-rich protein [Hirsutella rhossiliensis]|uniref:Conserved glutamic acid-rich protein n=1 Tax=Hirsutella rhossiliensis TaxID=111463 RepID=A0A9P8MRJ7_9HYPO|nr:conserved glutamic acid-rich protein [Hirsutella rhossiliensis]KAH0960578.1 conserved glutamic acid-rich protein [Hirsutella rhossiliensis]